MAKKKKTPDVCKVDECWQQARVKGFCTACYSWDRRIGKLTPEGLQKYIDRTGRTLHRFDFKKLW